MEIYKGSREVGFLNRARDMAQRVMGHYVQVTENSGYFSVNDTDRPYFSATDEGTTVVALLNYCGIEPDAARRAKALAIAEKAMRFHLDITGEVKNPFVYARVFYQNREGARGKRTHSRNPHEENHSRRRQLPLTGGSPRPSPIPAERNEQSMREWFRRDLEESRHIHRPLRIYEEEMRETRRLGKKVLSATLLDDLTTLDHWETVTPYARMELSREHTRRCENSVKFSSVTRLDHWPGAADTACWYITDIVLEILPEEALDVYEGWQAGQGRIAFSGSGYKVGCRKTAIANAPGRFLLQTGGDRNRPDRAGKGHPRTGGPARHPPGAGFH